MRGKNLFFHIHLILFNSGDVPKSGAKIIKKVDNKNLLCLTEEKEKLTEKKMGKVHKSIDHQQKIRKIRKNSFVYEDGDLLFKLENQLDVLLSLHQVRKKNSVLVDFD